MNASRHGSTRVEIQRAKRGEYRLLELPQRIMGHARHIREQADKYHVEPHYHPLAEEIYYITHGTGRIRIEGELREVKPGDAIAIPPGQKHKLWNTGADVLCLLCCCAPAYEHADTIITET